MIADDVYFPTDEAAAAAPTGVADDARGTPDEAAAAALDEAAAPETKRLRILGKRVSASPASPSHVVPRADDAEAASATGPATAYHAEIWGCTSRRRTACNTAPLEVNAYAGRSCISPRDVAFQLTVLEVGEHLLQVPNRESPLRRCYGQGRSGLG